MTVFRNLRRLSYGYVAPTVDPDTGRPVGWQPNPLTTTIEDWGYLKVTIDGTDVTVYRGVPVEIRPFSHSSPFSEQVAAFFFPQIAPWDTVGGHGEPAWAATGKLVEISVVRPDTTETTLWEGLSASYSLESGGLTIECIGALRQCEWAAQQPALVTFTPDIVTHIKTALDTVPGRLYADSVGTDIGVTSTQRGARTQTKADIIAELLASSTKDDGSTALTVTNVHPRTPTVDWKDLTTVHWTIWPGAYGVELALTRDLTSAPSRIYGEGTRDDGGYWANTKYPTDGTDPYYAAIYSVPGLDPRLYDANGNDIGANPDYDPTILPIEKFESMGENITLSLGMASAQAEVLRYWPPGLVGTIKLGLDPLEGHRFEIREGQNIQVKGLWGTDTLFHVVQAEHDPWSGQTTLTVDTKGRDLMPLYAVLARDREAKQTRDALALQRRRSRMTPDTIVQWDSEAGAGKMGAAVAVTANTWTIIKIPLAEQATVAAVVAAAGSGLRSDELGSSPNAPFGHADAVPGAVEFAFGIFSTAVNQAALDGLVGDPLTGTKPWSTNSDALMAVGLYYAAGGPDNPAGYYPEAKTNADGTTGTLTGKHYDGMTWPFFSDSPPWAWLAVYASADCDFIARLYEAPRTA